MKYIPGQLWVLTVLLLLNPKWRSADRLIVKEETHKLLIYLSPR